MASAFNLTAQINLRGPSNVRNIVSDIRRQLGTITGDVNLRINPATTRNVTALNTALTTLNNNLRTTSANATDAANAIRQFGSAISSIGNSAAGLNRNLGNTATAANNAAAGIRNTATNTQAASAEMVEFGRTAGLAVRRFAAFSMSAGAIMGLTNAIRQGIDAFIEYDKQFVKLQQVTGESASGLSQLANTITQLSTSLGVSSKDLTEVSLTLTQAGLTARDTERALKALALSSLAPSFDNMNQTVEGSIALMRQFGISAIDLEKSLGAVNAVSAKFAVEASDIIAAIQRTGGVFASASKGVSEGTDALNEFIAVFTSVRATTRESAETIATGLRTIFTRIQRGGTIEALKEFGVNLTDAEGKFVGAYKAVQLLSEGLNQIDPRDLKFSQIVEELGGFRQIGKVIPLIQQFATAQDALRVAQQGQGSLAADAAKAQASLANQAAKVREEFLALFREIGGSDTFQALAKGALSLASALISVADSVKGVLPVLAIMMAFKGASGIRQFGTGFLRGLRPAQGAKFGGKIGKYKLGGDVDVPVALTPGEAVIFPEYAAKIGTPTLRKMNYADKRQKRAKGGKIGIVPGQGNSDSFYTTLPEGSFVIRKAATEAMGPSNIEDVAKGRARFITGGRIQNFAKGSKETLKSKFKDTSIYSKGGKKSTAFAHLDEQIPIGKSASRAMKLSGNWVGLTNVGLDLPASWNLDWSKPRNYQGVSAKRLADYIKTNNVFSNLLTQGGKTYGRLSGGDKSEALSILKNSANKIRQKLSSLIISNQIPSRKEKIGDEQVSLPKGWYDTDRDIIATPKRLFFQAINSVLGKGSYESQKLTESLEEVRGFRNKTKKSQGLATANSQSQAYGTTIKFSKKMKTGLGSMDLRKAAGGYIQKFMAGSVEPLTFPGRKKFLKVIKTPEASSLIGDRDAYKILGKKPESRSGQDAADFETLMAAYREAVKNSTSPDPVTATAQTAAATKEETRKSKEPGARKKPITVGAIGLTGKRGEQVVRSKQGTKITVQKGVIDPGLSRRFRADVRKVSRELAKKWGGIFAAQSGSSPVVDKKELNRILGPGLSNITGAVFEAALASAGAPYEATLRKRPIDFPQGLGRVGAIAGLPGDLATEAKTDLSSAALTRVATQADPSPRKKQPKKRAKLKYGGFPLVDDLPNAPGSLTPMPGIGPGSPLYKIIKNKGGVLDYDRTLQRTVGDAAYASAKTEEQRNAVLNRYFRDSSARLQDAKTAKLTQFGQQLQALIKKGIIDPKKLSIISKSSKTEGLPEHINRLFGIPTTNMEFTSGQSKVGLLQEIRKKGPKSYRRYTNGGSLYKNDKNKQAGYDPKKLAEFLGASPAVTDKQKKLAEMLNDGKIEKPNYEELLKKARGYAAGGEIPIMAQEGEYVINRKSAKAIGYGNLNKLNKYHSGGVVQKFARGSWEPLDSASVDPEVQRRQEEAERRRRDAEARRNRQEERRNSRRQNAQSMVNTAATTVGYYNLDKLGRDLVSNPEGYQMLREKRSTPRAQKAMRKIDSTMDDLYARDPNREARRSRAKRNALTRMAVDDTIRQQKNQATFGKTLGDTVTALGTFRRNLFADPLATLRDAARKTAKSLDDSVTANRKNNQRGGGAETLLGVRRQGTQARQAMDDIRGMTSDVPTGTGAFGRSTRRVSVFGTSSADIAAMSGQSKADVAAAKKATLIAAGYGKGGAQATAIQAANRTAGVGLGAAAGMSTNQVLAAARGGKNGGGSGGGGGRGGSDGGNMMGRAMTASFMIPMITEMFTGGTPTTTSGAYSQSLTQGTATTIGSSLMMGSMVNEMTQGMGGIAGLAGPAAMAVTAVVGMTKAFIDAENAAREMAISLASKNLETSLETTSKAFDEFQKDLKNEVKQRVVEQQIGKSTGMADQLQKEKSRARRGFANLFDTGQGSSERSDILFEKGMGDYFSAAFGGAETQKKLFASLIPKKSAEAAKDYAGTAQISSQLIEQKIRSGTRIKDVAGTPDFNNLTRSLALADAAVQEQILNIQNSIDMTQEEKNAKKELLIVQEGEKKAREIQATTLKQMQLDELSKSANHLQNSLERMFQNMEQAIGRNVFELNNLSQQAELSAAALSGNAKAGQISLKSINVLQNPRAYNKAQRVEASQNAANMFGSESGDMKGLLQAGGTLQDTIMSTINKTMKEDPNAGNEKIGIKIQNNIEEALSKLKLSKDISNKLGQEVNTAIGEIRQKKDEKIDFGDLMEKIPQLGKVMESTRRAQEDAIKALEHWQNNLNDYSNAMNQMVDATVEANSRFRRASDIQVRGQMELDKALGKEISLRKQLDVALAGVKAQTGGETNPALIGQNIRTLETQRATQQSMSNTAGQRGYAGADEFMMMENRLRNTNIALRENYDALKTMADNTEMASIAMAKINEIQQKRQAGVNMAERLVTSSPQELSQLNRAMDRLNNNMQGGINFGSSADQRKESLDAFNMIAPFLGEKQNDMKANVLESMLIESGVGINPMMSDVLESLRNPEADPQMQEAIAEYKKAVNLQTLANTELGNISALMTQNTSEIAAAKLVSAMKSVPFTFENAQLKDIAAEIKTLRTIVEKNPAVMAQGRADGGIIYAAAGQMVNFQPKGTDTVPAMLTPGEFVVNRAATQRNLPLLKNINSGNYSNGGKVSYYADGGYVVTGGFAPKDAAKNASESFARTSIVEKESNSEYPIINDNKPLSEDAVKNATQRWETLHPLFYATEPVPRNNILVSQRGPDGNLAYPAGAPTFNTMPVFGWGYDSVKRDKDGKVTFGGVVTAPEYRGFHYDGIPKKDTFDQDIFNPVNPNTRKIKLSEAPVVSANLETIMKFLAEVTELNGKQVNVHGTRIKLDTPSNVPSLRPSFTSNADGSAEIKGLTTKNYEYKQYFVPTEKITDIFGKARTSDIGNIIGFGTNKGPAVVSGKENFYEKGIQTTSGGSGAVYRADVPYGPPKMANFSSVIQEYQKDTIPTLQLAQNIRSSILRYQDALGPQNSWDKKFQSETKESLGNKQNVSDLVNLYNGTVASIKLDKPTIEPSAIDGSPLAPITVYNEAISARWTEYQAKLLELKNNKAKNKEPVFQYSDDNMDELGINYNGNEKAFRWTDANFSLDDYDEIFREAVTSPDMVQQPVITSPGNYDKNGIKFSYIKYDPKSRLYLETEKRFGRSFQELGRNEPNVIIPPQGNDGAMKPFNPFLGIKDPILSWHEKSLDQYISTILKDKNNFGFSIPTLASDNGIPYSPVYDESRKDWSYIKGAGKPFNLDEFFKAREANMEKIKNETALSYAKTDFSIGEYAKIDDAKRITLAREFYKVAKNDKDVPALVKSSIGNEITSIADIGNTAISIGSKIPKSLFPGDYEREKIDAWRAVFAEIYLDKDKGLKKLQNFGVDLSDNKFMGTKETGTTDLGEEYIKYWHEMDVSPDLLKQIVNRQVMSKMTGQTSTKFIQTEDDKIKGDSYTFGSTGQGKVESSDQATPDSWNRLREVALDPQRIFSNIIDRHELINKLILFYEKGKNKYGGDLLPDDLAREKTARLRNLTKYFSEFDNLVNTELKTGNSDAENATIPWGLQNNYYEYFEDSLKAISSDEGQTKWNKFSSGYQQYLNLETGRDTLNANQVEALIRASSSLKEEQQKKKDQNQEGAGNKFSGVQTFATGGMVYASKGTLVNYQPRGTDTVPAMLTPGEFVINREATQKHLPVLKAINEGYYSRGGIAKYLANGGIISPNYYANPTGPVASNNKMFDLSSYMGDLVGQITSAITIAFQNASSNMGGLTGATQSNGVSSIDSDALNKIGEFTNRLKSVADTLAGLSAIPQEITITVTHTHNVIINGDAALNKLSPDLQEIAMSTIREKFAELAAANQIAGSPLIDPFQV